MASFGNLFKAVMLASMLSAGAVLHGCQEVSSGMEATDNRYHAYWLEPKDSTQATGYFALLLTRGPIHSLDITHLHKLESEGFSADELLASPAIVFLTYQKDSIWNMDKVPFKVACCFVHMDTREKILIKENEAMQRETFYYRQAPLGDVVRLLEQPKGSIPISRIYQPLTGGEAYVEKLLPLLKNELH